MVQHDVNWIYSCIILHDVLNWIYHLRFSADISIHLLPIRESEAPVSARLAPAYPAMMYRGLLPVKFTTKYVIQIAHFPQEISFRLILAHNWGQFLSNFSCDGLQHVKFSNMLQKSLEK